MKPISPILFVALSCLSAHASATLPDPVIPNNIGVHIHFKSDDPNMVQHLVRIRAAGARVVRFGLYWELIDTGLVNNQPDYHWEIYDGLIYESLLHGLTPLIVLSYGNPAYPPRGTEEFLTQFTRYATDVVSRYANRGIIWELWNEPNWGWPLTPSEYMALANRVFPAIRNIDATGTLLGPALSSPNYLDTEYATQCFSPYYGPSLLDWVDGVSIHPYRWGANELPDNVLADYAALRTLMNTPRPNNTVKIVDGEWGYSVGGGISEQKQADYVARMILSDVRYRDDKQNGIPLSIWFDYCGLPVDDGGLRYFGLFGSDYFTGQENGPKPAFYAMKTLTAELRGSTYGVSLDDGHSEQKIMTFASPATWGTRGTVVAWTTGTNSLFSDPWWGNLLLTNTPLYLGEALHWGSGSGNWSDNNWTGGTWPDDWGSEEYHYNYQAVFDTPDESINVDGEYKLGGMQFNANGTVLDGGTLRATPGGGNLYVAGNCFDVVTSVIADAVDRRQDDDPIAYTNTPETFILRKSGDGEVALIGDNTFHGTVLVAQGYLSVGDKGLGDDSNPLQLAGGGVDFYGHNVTTGPLTITADSDMGNYAASTSSRYTFGSATISSNFSVSGAGNLELAGPVNVTGAYTITKNDASTLTISGPGISLASDVTFNTALGSVNLTAPISGAGRVLKSGPGSLVLSNANSYTGATVVNAGSLEVSGSIGSGTVTVSAGASLTLSAGGTISNSSTANVGGALYQNSSTPLSVSGLFINRGGTLGGVETVQNSLDVFGRLSPGRVGLGAVGVLSLAGNLRLYYNSVLDIDIASTSYDRVAMLGSGRSVTLAGTLNVYNRTGFGTIPTGSYTLVSGFATYSGLASLRWGLRPPGRTYSLVITDAPGGLHNLVLNVS